MRILYLHQYFITPKEIGGTRSYEMARRLVSWGHTVEMVTSQRDLQGGGGQGWQESDESGIHVHRLSVPYSNSMSYSRRIAAFFKFAVGAALKAASLKADVAFATSTPLTIAIPGVYAARRQKIPMVFEVRDLWPELPIAMGALKGAFSIFAARRLEHWAYRNSAQIIALSPGMKAGVVRKGYPEALVHVIPNSSDIELFTVPKERGKEFRRRYQWLLDRPLVVYTGTIGRVNGIEYMAKLAVSMLKLDPEVRFLVVGEGGEKGKVQGIAKGLGVLDKNFFMIDSLPKTEIAAVLSAADIATSFFIDLPELWANSANKFFDAFASGTPVAINYRGWQAEILEETGAGIVLDAHSMDLAAVRLMEILRDKPRLARAGQVAQKLAEERFSRDKLAKQLEGVLLGAAQK